MHWAAHKHTAAEVIYQRADAEKDNIGLTSWASDTIRRSDVEVAKNYLTEQELDKTHAEYAKYKNRLGNNISNIISTTPQSASKSLKQSFHALFSTLCYIPGTPILPR